MTYDKNLEIEEGLGGQALAVDGPIAGMLILLPGHDTREITLNGVAIEHEGRLIKYLRCHYRINHYGDGWNLAFLDGIVRSPP